MKKFLTALDNITALIYQNILVLSGTAVVSLIMIGAFMRYVIKKDFFGSEEITLFIAFWLYFIGSALAAREKSHINANMLSLFTKDKKITKVFDIIRTVLSLIICGVVMFWCYKYIFWSFKLGAKSNIFKIPNIIAQFPILLSFICWFAYLIRDLLEILSDKKEVAS